MIGELAIHSQNVFGHAPPSKPRLHCLAAVFSELSTQFRVAKELPQGRDETIHVRLREVEGTDEAVSSKEESTP